MKAVVSRAMEMFGEFNAQNSASTAWAFTKMDIKDDALMDAVASRTLEILPEFNSQDLANTVWAFAKVEVMDGALMKAISNRALETLVEFNSQDLANTVWAFSKLEMADEALMNAVATRSLEILEEFQALNLANMAWACGKLQMVEEELLLKAVSSRALDIFGGILHLVGFGEHGTTSMGFGRNDEGGRAAGGVDERSREAERAQPRWWSRGPRPAQAANTQKSSGRAFLENEFGGGAGHHGVSTQEEPPLAPPSFADLEVVFRRYRIHAK